MGHRSLWRCWLGPADGWQGPGMLFPWEFLVPRLGGAEEEDTCSDLVSASALGRVCCEPALPRGFYWTVPVAIWRALARGDGTVTLAGSGLPGDIVGDE